MIVLTDEQEAILDIFSSPSRPSMAIEALAGAGKTTMLVEIGRELDYIRPGAVAHYVTFNAKNAKDVKEKFAKAYGGKNVIAKTMHSLAWGSVARDPEWKHLIDKMRISRQPLYKIRGSFVQGCTFSYRTTLGKDKYLGEGDLYYAARSTVSNFCKSAEREISPSHVPRLDKLPGDDDVSQGEYARIVLPIARRLWDDILNPDGVAAIEHDHYLKVWQLTNPVIGEPGDVILYDEAQDARPCITDIIYSQEHCQKVAVGDHYQAIYYFTGAVNALRKIMGFSDVKTAQLTTSWRFGENVAQSATDVLRYIGCDSLTVRGNPGVDSRVYAYGEAPPMDVDAYITRSNAEAISILIKVLSSGLKAHAVMDVNTVVDACDDITLMMGGKSAKKISELRDLENLAELEGVLDKERSEGKKILSGSALYSIILDEGPVNIKNTVKQTVPANKADVVISTVHKAKGLEWDRVALVWDSHRSLPRRGASSEGHRKPWGDYFAGNLLAEQMLLYVAITRARQCMYIPEEIARVMGITVDNENSFPRWKLADSLDYIRSGGEHIPFREGKPVEVPVELDELAIELRGKLLGDHEWPGAAYSEKQLPTSEILRLLPQDMEEVLKGPKTVQGKGIPNKETVDPVALRYGLESMV